MEKRFCSYCGTPLKDGSLFCHSCGAQVDAHRAGVGGRYAEYAVYPERHRPLPFSCLLAYIPCLFWLPLLTDHKDNRHRECANQGLWLTLTFFLFGMGVYYGGQAAFDAGIFSIDRIVQLFQGWDSYSWTEKVPVIAGLQAMVGFSLYAPINGLCGFFHGMGSQTPYILPVFGRIHLIRLKRNKKRVADEP